MIGVGYGKNLNYCILERLQTYILVHSGATYAVHEDVGIIGEDYLRYFRDMCLKLGKAFACGILINRSG